MANKYQLLEDLERLRKAGTISEEEYQNEREKIFNMNANSRENSSAFFGMKENTYLMLMHLSLFAGIITLGLGLIAPIILWAIYKDNSSEVDRHGKNIFNMMISWAIYTCIAMVLNYTIILAIIGLPLLIILLVLPAIFIIIASINAEKGIFWEYPLSIPFFATQKDNYQKNMNDRNNSSFK